MSDAYDNFVERLAKFRQSDQKVVPWNYSCPEHFKGSFKTILIK